MRNQRRLGRLSSKGSRRTAGMVAAAMVTAVTPLVVLPAGASAADGPYDPYFASPTTVATIPPTAFSNPAPRPFGQAAGDYNGDGAVDLISGRVDGNVYLSAGHGNGTFAASVQVAPGKLTTNNAWAFAPGDINSDGNLDLIWGATTAYAHATAPIAVGDVRVWYGNGDGTFQNATGFVNTGALLANVGNSSVGSIAGADIDGDDDLDIVAGVSGALKLLRNNGAGSFTTEDLSTAGTYFAPTWANGLVSNPWGLAFGDADGDHDLDLWVGDRALYVYLYKNDGTGTFTVTPGNIPGLETRPNVYLRHDSYRAAVGHTASLASADVNGDSKADVFVGLHSGTQTPASNIVNDGVVLLDISKDGGHSTLGPLGDLGTMTRGLQTADVNGDGATDLLGAVYEGQVKLLRQLPPLDADADGISDYVDNAPNHANAPRIEMNADGSLNAADQLDNDFDTVLGDPEDESTWSRLGDPADEDDDNDGVPDGSDNCAFGANADQANKDGDLFGDACDPLNNSDVDGDGVPTFDPADPLYAMAKAARATWATHETKFVLRNDALGRFFQNEFTQLLTDATILTPEEWAAKCWENYDPGDVSATYEPCGDDATKTLSLPGGGDVPMSLVVIPKHLWTDPPVVTWINDRNDNPNLEIGQHGTFHDTPQLYGDWKDMEDRYFFSCEGCGLTEAESYERLKLGYDMLMGDYDKNRYLRDMGAVEGVSPEIDWNDSARQLITYAAPFNTSDDTARKAMAQYGIRSFTASIHEESGSAGYGEFFASPGYGNQHETLDHWGMFHGSADTQLDPVETPDGVYGDAEKAEFLAQMQAETEVGGLNTWLIEEVEWSGRTNNEAPRETDASAPGGINRETNTVYQPRWQQWMDLLDYVKANGVVMTLDDVALAMAFDNAPTIANADQADSDADGIGDVAEAVAVTGNAVELSRNVPGALSATVTSGGTPLAGQPVTFGFDADEDGTEESYTGTTDDAGVATAAVTATRPVGTAPFTVSWGDGQDGSATGTGEATIVDATTTSITGNPGAGQVTDSVGVSATVVDSDGVGLPGRSVTFTLGAATATATTDSAGVAAASLTLEAPVGPATLTASHAGGAGYGASTASAPFTIAKEVTSLAVTSAAGSARNSKAVVATLTDDDGTAVAGKTVTVTTPRKVRGQTVQEVVGSAVTGADGVARVDIAAKYLSKSATVFTAAVTEDSTHLGDSDQVSVSR